MPIILILLVIGAAFLGKTVADDQSSKRFAPFLNQQQEIQVEQPTITLSPTFTVTPTPTPVPQVKVNQIVPTPYDPIVECVSEWEKQKGITKKVKKSACDRYIDCQLGGGAVGRVPSKEYCEEVQRLIAEKKQNQQTGDMVTCKLSYGDFGTLTREQCQNIVNDHVKKELHEKNLRDAEQLLIQYGYSPEEISKKLQEYDQEMKSQGM